MTIEELTEKVSQAKAKGLERVLLVIHRKTPPGRFKNEIMVRGLGTGEVVSCQEKDGMHYIFAWFRCDVIDKSIERYTRGRNENAE